MNKDNVLLMIEELSGMSRLEFGSVSLNGSKPNLFKIVVFNIGKTTKGGKRSWTSQSMPLEDATQIFHIALEQVYANRDTSDKATSIAEMYDLVIKAKEANMKLVPAEVVEEDKDEKMPW